MEVSQTRSGNKAHQVLEGDGELLEELCQKQENSPALKPSVHQAAWFESEFTSVMQVEAMLCALYEVAVALGVLNVCIRRTNDDSHRSVACLFYFCHGILSSGHGRDF